MRGGAWAITRGIETSQYPEERKAKAIPRVAASESGEAQTNLRIGVVGRPMEAHDETQPNGIGRPAGGGASPVGEASRRREGVP